MKKELQKPAVPHPASPAKQNHTPAIPAGKFKAICLDLLDQVKERHQEYIITKRGEPFAKLTPVDSTYADPFGFMRGTVIDSAGLLEADNDSWAESESDPLLGA